MADDEGLDFASAFGAKFGSLTATDQRLKAERRANQTTAQRARVPVRTIQVNFRARPETKALAEQLAKQLKCSVADIMERALETLAQQHKSAGPSP